MRLALVVAATAACSCGRLRFDEVPDAAPDAIALPATCDWSSGPPFTAPPQLRAELSSPLTEVDPFLAPGDPLTMWFGSARDGALDLYVATRPSLDAPFEQVQAVTDLNTVGGIETGLILDITGMTGYYTKDVTIHAVVRDVPGGPLRDAGQVSELALATEFQDAWPSPDGLTLTFSAGTSPSQIYTATRANRGDAWTNIMPSAIDIPGVNAGGATVTANQLVMVWARQNPGGIDLHYAVRADPKDPFVERGFVFDPPTGMDFEASIRDDGCELFFGRTLDTNTFDIYSLVATP